MCDADVIIISQDTLEQSRYHDMVKYYVFFNKHSPMDECHSVSSAAHIFTA